jgi:hypothetical protein
MFFDAQSSATNKILNNLYNEDQDIYHRINPIIKDLRLDDISQEYVDILMNAARRGTNDKNFLKLVKNFTIKQDLTTDEINPQTTKIIKTRKTKKSLTSIIKNSQNQITQRNFDM